MKFENFNKETAAQVIKLWEEYLGFWGEGSKDRWELQNPDSLIMSVENSSSWLMGRYESRPGSRYDYDTKLFMSEFNGRISEIECYIQHPPIDKKEEAELAESQFNKGIKNFLETQKL